VNIKMKRLGFFLLQQFIYQYKSNQTDAYHKILF
jgi:hypothetical protein